MVSKLMTLLSMVVIAAAAGSCDRENAAIQPEEEIRYVSLSESPADAEVTAVQVGQSHGDLVMIFMDKLFNKTLKDPTAKSRFLANNGVDASTFKAVFIESVNQYFQSEGKYIRMTDQDYIYLAKNVPYFRSGSPEEVRAQLQRLNEQGCLSDRALAQVIAEVQRIEQAVANQCLPVENAEVLLAPPVPYGPEGEFDMQVFNEIAINSVQTWSVLMEDSDWIDDPELRDWWDWFRASEKGRAIGAILADGIGGIAFCLLSAGNPIWTAVGAVASSVMFCAWAYQGM